MVVAPTALIKKPSPTISNPPQVAEGLSTYRIALIDKNLQQALVTKEIIFINQEIGRLDQKIEAEELSQLDRLEHFK